LIRAATLVTMLPELRARASREALIARKQAVANARSLTHWVDKAAPLGEELREEAALEQRRIECIKNWQETAGKKVLLDWKDLTECQRRLVVGKTFKIK